MSDFVELMPESLSSDQGIRNIAEILESHLARTDAAVASILLIARLSGEEKPLAPALERLVQRAGGLESLDERLLALMAWQYHVDDYDMARSLEARLDMVRTAIALHRKKGTSWAVRRAIDAAFQQISTTVQEWFEYGGEPYHFRVNIDVYGDGIMQDAVARAGRLIESNKSKRSLCDGITLALTSLLASHCGSAICSGLSMIIEPELIESLALETPMTTAGIGVHHDESLTIYPE